MKSHDFYHIYDGHGKERPMPKEKLPVHYYPNTGEVFDKIGNFIGDGEIKNDKLIITVLL